MGPGAPVAVDGAQIWPLTVMIFGEVTYSRNAHMKSYECLHPLTPMDSPLLFYRMEKMVDASWMPGIAKSR